MMEVHVVGLQEAIRGTGLTLKQLRRPLRKGFRKIGRVVKDAAVPRTPISPTKAQYVASLKGGQTKRTDFQPGNLRRSIQVMSATDKKVEVGVPDNSRGGLYADFIHNDTYELGPGSKAAFSEGEPVGNKFLIRAAEANQKNFKKILEREIRKYLRTRR